jgi:N-acetylglucosamine-6-phosphate deacetylase
MRTVIYNGKLILKDRISEQGFIEITDGIITQVSLTNPIKTFLSDADSIIDAQKMYISPGFIDIHTHGGGGYEFGEKDEDSFIVPCKIHALHGTTSLYPTISSSTFDIMEKAVVLYKKAIRTNYAGASIEDCILKAHTFQQRRKEHSKRNI